MEPLKDITPILKSKFALAIYILFAIIYIGIVGRGHADFYIYLSASKDLFDHKDVYTAIYGECYHYYYSVFFAIIIYPLTFFPLLVAQYIWLFTNAFLIWKIANILGKYFKMDLLPVKQQWIFFILGCALTAKVTLANLYDHQITILLLYFTLQGLENIFSDKHVSGAFLIALGINIKILPVFVIPYLIYRKQFLATFLIIFGSVVLLFIPTLVIGINQNNALLASWWNLVNPTNPEHVMDVSQRGFQSITSLLSVLLTEVKPDKYDLLIKRNIANLSFEQLNYVINSVRLAFVIFALYFLRTKPFVSKISAAHRYWEISYILFIIPVLFPHQQHYSFVFCAPAILHILYYLLKDYRNYSAAKRLFITVTLTISFLAVNATFLLGEFNPYYDHFKVVGWGILLLVPLLAIVKPTYPIAEQETL